MRRWLRAQTESVVSAIYDGALAKSVATWSGCAPEAGLRLVPGADRRTHLIEVTDKVQA